MLGPICPANSSRLARDFLRPPEEIPPRYHVRAGFRPLDIWCSCIQRHIIIHQGKDVQATDSTGRFAFLWPGEDLCRQIEPCFRHQRDLTPEMPSCLFAGAPACCHAVKIGQSCQRLRLAKRFQLFQSAIKRPPRVKRSISPIISRASSVTG